MRNLVASSIRRWRLPLAPNLASADGASEQIVATCYDAESRVTYAVTDACNLYGVRDSAREGDDAELCLEMCLVESVPSATDAFDTPGEAQTERARVALELTEKNQTDQTERDAAVLDEAQPSAQPSEPSDPPDPPSEVPSSPSPLRDDVADDSADAALELHGEIADEIDVQIAATQQALAVWGVAPAEPPAPPAADDEPPTSPAGIYHEARSPPRSGIYHGARGRRSLFNQPAAAAVAAAAAAPPPPPLLRPWRLRSGSVAHARVGSAGPRRAPAPKAAPG